ncbi:hypothetical protein ACFWNN_09620 [Lentzea sp. NPDC058450]|uniref:hypothetical protein n=1 Tax=Lentzea sp. NPDC058450 TaxID=3346505 RepID=UPI00365EF1D5
MTGALVAAATLGTTTGTAAAQDGGEVEIFWDHDRDGVRQDGEPPFVGGSFQVSTSDHLAYRLTTTYTGEATLDPGRWTVTFDDSRFLVTTAASGVVDPARGSPKLVIGVVGASVCGTAWLDENADGARQDGERGIEQHLMYIDYLGAQRGDTTVATGGDGTYCFHDVPAGEAAVRSHDRRTIDGLAWGDADWRAENPDEGQASRFDVRDGRSRTLTVGAGAEVTGLDTAFVSTEGRDARALSITIVNDDGSTDPRDLRVGDRVAVKGRYRVDSPARDNYKTLVELPLGMKVVEIHGVPGAANGNDDTSVYAEFPDRQPPGQEVEVVVIATVDEPFEHREIALHVAGLDADRGNDRYSVLVRALPADPKPEGWRWDLFVPFLAVSALLVGVALWRRRSAK